MPTPIRQKRVAEQIRAEISQLLQREMRDPRLGLVTVTRVMVDRELVHADVYVSTLGDDARHTEVLQALDSASGFLRREVGRRVKLRQTPHLVFHWDPGMENMENVARLLDQIKHTDAAPQSGEGESGTVVPTRSAATNVAPSPTQASLASAPQSGSQGEADSDRAS